MDLFENVESSTSIGSEDIYEASYSGKMENDDYEATGTENYLNAGCYYENEAQNFISFLLFNFFAMFIMPLFVMTLCYGLIIRRLIVTRMRACTPVSFSADANNKRPKIQRTNSSSRPDKDRRRVTIMCAALVSCFVICWLPFHAIHLAKMASIYNTSTATCKLLLKVGSILAYLNSALNPYLYSFLATNFSRRWNSATNTFRASVYPRRNPSTGSFANARPPPKNATEKYMSNTTTMTTKVNKSVKHTEEFTSVETTKALKCFQNNGHQSPSSVSSCGSFDKLADKQPLFKDI